MTHPEDRPTARLNIIIDQIDRVERRLAGVTFQEFAADRDLSDLIAFRVHNIGENCHKLDDALKARHPELPWIDIYGMRNIISHDYERIAPSRVWSVAREHLGDVREMAGQELARSQEKGRDDGPERDGPQR